jgi:MFS family permease
MKPDQNFTPADSATVNRARWAISTIFLLNGAGIGLWAAHVPLVQARAGIDTGTLGLLLLTIAGGAIAAMPLSGWLAGRWGTRTVALASAWLFSVTTVLLMNVEGLAALFLAAFAFGASNGVLDVSMNANASEVETARGVPTMSSFHGFFSLGGLLGAALGGVLIGADLGDGRGALMAGVAIAIVVALCAPFVLRVAPSKHQSHFALPRGPALFLGLLGMLCFAVEGALVDWSALLLTERTKADPASAAFGYSGGVQHAPGVVRLRLRAGRPGGGERGAAAVLGRGAHSGHVGRRRPGDRGDAGLRGPAAGAAADWVDCGAHEYCGGAGDAGGVGVGDCGECAGGETVMLF